MTGMDHDMSNNEPGHNTFKEKYDEQQEFLLKGLSNLRYTGNRQHVGFLYVTCWNKRIWNKSCWKRNMHLQLKVGIRENK